MAYSKTFEIFERSNDGLLKYPKDEYAYGESSIFHGVFVTEEEAIAAICKREIEYRDFIVVPVIRYKADNGEVI